MAKTSGTGWLWMGSMLLGSGTFIAAGVGFLIAEANTKPGELTDDGAPLDSFYHWMGLCFGGGGLLWLVIAVAAFFFMRGSDLKLEQRRAHLSAHGLRVDALVLSVETEGYMNFNNEIWVDLVLDVPVAGQVHRKSFRAALPQDALDRARAEKRLLLLVNAANPYDFVLARGST
jgi:hypothetical protein